MLDRVGLTIEKIGALLKYVAAGLLISVAILIAFDVVMRSVFNKPIIGVAEIVANGIVIIAYLQLSYTVRIGAMLRSEFLVARLGHRARIVFELFVSLLGVLFFGLIAWASYTPLTRAISSREFEGYASFQVPTWPLRATILTCSLLAVLTYLVVAYRALRHGEVSYTATVGAGTDGPRQGAV